MKNKATNNQQKKLKFDRLAIYGWRCTIFLISLGIGSIIFGKIIPSPEIPVVTSKLENFTKNKDKYNVVFIGSSKIYRHIVPSEFDKAMERRGKEISSYNFGVSSMQSLESYFFLKKILAMKPKNLEYIFIELQNIELSINRENWRTNRVIYWHDWEHTFWVFDLILDYQHSLRVKFGALKSHTIPLMYNLGGVGKVDGLIQWINNQGNQDNITFDRLNNRFMQNDYINGYLPLDQEIGVSYQQRRQNFLGNLNTYHEKVNLLNLPSDKVVNPNSTLLRVTKDLIQIVKDSDVTPIFMITPVLQKKENLIALKTKEYVSTLFLFNNPIEYPRLYAPELRFDKKHLNDKGAREFTELLAEKFSEYLDREKN
ncbi:hypothetical protein ACP6PL_21865 [Dapis sp. BLCC M126]|uniref:hypothetical protein n=1 Tax=Dapis sp. BLCC M126 TaxID=3400189 RepID=UPI003CF644C9